MKVNPDGTGAFKKTVSRRLESPEESGPQKSICWPKMLVGQELFDCSLATEGEGWLKVIDFPLAGCPMIMDPADEGDTARPPALDLIFSAVIPAQSNRLDPWESDQELYQKRNEVEGLFRGRKGFGRIFSGWDQLDRMFSAVWFLVLIVDSLRSC